MKNRYLVIWFCFFKTDWYLRRHPQWRNSVVVMYAPQHGRMMITACNAEATTAGIFTGMVLADARALVPDVHAVEDDAPLFEKVMLAFAKWFIRYSPAVAMLSTDTLVIDTTGCTHLWGGEEAYMQQIQHRMQQLGYTIRSAMADSIGAAWAVSHFANAHTLVPVQETMQAIRHLPPEALRIDESVSEKLRKLGFKQLHQFINLPIRSLQRRFGAPLVLRIQQAIGNIREHFSPVIIQEPYAERLQCFDPIATRAGIEIAIKKLLDTLCVTLQAKQLGMRIAVLTIYRVDNSSQSISISMHKPSYDITHIYQLFLLKIQELAPGHGIELFVLTATHTDVHMPAQEVIFDSDAPLLSNDIAQLVDRLRNKLGSDKVKRLLPAAHHWPERSFRQATDLQDSAEMPWHNSHQRPLYLLANPQPITVSAPVPDYPPMLFRFKETVHRIVKADGPERIEQEWWIQDGVHRDYYFVEDETGKRYWLFRAGHYTEGQSAGWYLHGFGA